MPTFDEIEDLKGKSDLVKTLTKIERENGSGFIPTPQAHLAVNKLDQRAHPELLAAIICDIDDTASVAAARKVIASINETRSNLLPIIQPAVTPKTLERYLISFGKKLTDWTWPIKPGTSRVDIKSGLTLHAYGARHYKKVIACLMSHMIGWRLCALTNTPMVILEHDAIFTRRFNWNSIPACKEKHECIIGLNNPLGATRKAREYYTAILNANEIQIMIDADNPKNKTGKPFRTALPFKNVPTIDDIAIPQGLAGNSAYIMNPTPAKKLFGAIDKYGMWPNDAIMCQQILGPNMLKQMYPYVTGLQGVASTTQG